MPFVIIDNQTNKAVGSSRYLFIQPTQKNLEIGFTFYNQDHRRTSTNTESKILLLSNAFESFECIRVMFKTDLRNIASQNALERIGAKKEGILRKWQILHDGHQRNAVVYSIIDDEWKEVKENLMKKLINL